MCHLTVSELRSFFCDFTTEIPINLPDPTMDLHKGIMIYSDPAV